MNAAIPDHMWAPLWRYLDHGWMPGDFLTAVLCNNLREAVGRADEENEAALPAWVRWLYNHAPGAAWGSPEKVKAWAEGGGFLGLHGQACPRKGV